MTKSGLGRLRNALPRSLIFAARNLDGDAILIKALSVRGFSKKCDLHFRLVIIVTAAIDPYRYHHASPRFSPQQKSLCFCGRRKAINRPTCTECVRAMALAKDEFLIRIACANCRQAEREKALSRESSGHLVSRESGSNR